MTAIARYRQLQLREQWLVVETICALALIPALLRMIGLRHLTSLLQRWPEVRRTNQWTPSDVALLVERASTRLGWTTSCLHRSLVAAWCMQRRGLSAALVIGVRRNAEGFAAHAWVDYPGRAPFAVDNEYSAIAAWHLRAAPSPP